MESGAFGDIIGWVWILLVILWSIKAAADQKKLKRREANRGESASADRQSESQPAVTPDEKMPATAEQHWKDLRRPMQRPKVLSQTSGRQVAERPPKTLQRHGGGRGVPTAAPHKAVERDFPEEAVSLETLDVEELSLETSAIGDLAPIGSAAQDIRTTAARSAISPLETSLGESFDLRRAVLYAEILKPKFDE